MCHKEAHLFRESQFGRRKPVCLEEVNLLGRNQFAGSGIKPICREEAILLGRSQFVSLIETDLQRTGSQATLFRTFGPSI